MEKLRPRNNLNKLSSTLSVAC